MRAIDLSLDVTFVTDPIPGCLKPIILVWLFLKTVNDYLLLLVLSDLMKS